MTYDLAVLRALRLRCAAATGPDRELDAEICAAFRILSPKLQRQNWLVNWGKPFRANFHKPGTVDAPSDPARVGVWWEADRVTSSIDVAMELVERLLSGWCIRIGTCSVSDDAWLAPDPAGPDAHLLQHRQFDDGFDVDRRPSGNMSLALLQALLEAIIAKQEAPSLAPQSPLLLREVGR